MGTLKDALKTLSIYLLSLVFLGVGYWAGKRSLPPKPERFHVIAEGQAFDTETGKTCVFGLSDDSANLLSPEVWSSAGDYTAHLSLAMEKIPKGFVLDPDPNGETKLPDGFKLESGPKPECSKLENQ